jgi:hypothetical protein
MGRSIEGRSISDLVRLKAKRGGILAMLLAGALVAACARSAKKSEPVASLSQSSDAANDFLLIHEAWEARRPEAKPIEEFLAQYPKDGAAPLAKLYLVFIAFEHGEVARGDALLTGGEQLPGTTRDLGTVLRARSLRLHGAPQSALDQLRSLVGKVVDDADREVFLEEVALCAIAAHDDYEAIGYLDAWLRGVGEDDKDRVRAKIEATVETLPRKVLEDTYRSMRAAGAQSGYGADIQKIVSERLARIAVQTNDAALARWLIDQSGVSAAKTGGDAGVELGELAASRRGIANFSGRTVGLLVPMRDRELRDEAADVVRGISWALGLPRKAGAPEGVRLVTRDDGIDDATSTAALEELMGEGVGIIVGGFDRASADRAVQWSEKSGVPVLLLDTPSPELMPKKNAVVLGDRLEREMAMLDDALLAHGAKTVAFVYGTDDEVAASKEATAITLLPPVKCDIPLAEAGRARFPIDDWSKKGAKGWFIAGSTQCAKDVLRDIGLRPGPVALSLEAGIPLALIPKNVTVLSASAGIIPVLASKPEEAKDEETRQFMEQLGVRPSWWTALGHDAGALAKGALSKLPNDTTTDAKQIADRRAQVQAGLLATRVRLWTTNERGITPERVLDRSLQLVTYTPAKH